MFYLSLTLPLIAILYLAVYFGYIYSKSKIEYEIETKEKIIYLLKQENKRLKKNLGLYPHRREAIINTENTSEKLREKPNPSQTYPPIPNRNNKKSRVSPLEYTILMGLTLIFLKAKRDKEKKNK